MEVCRQTGESEGQKPLTLATSCKGKTLSQEGVLSPTILMGNTDPARQPGDFTLPAVCVTKLKP